jgi:WD40 repeat protein
VTFSPDGHYLAGGVAMPTGDDRSAELKVWDLAAGTGRTLSVVRPGGGFYFLAFHPDGRTLVSTGFEGTITAWDVSSGRTLGTLNPGDKYALNSMEFSPDGRLLATSGEGGVRLWRVVRE